MEKRITSQMVEHFNLKMKEEGSCLRYIAKSTDGDTVYYSLAIEDKYISKEFEHSINLTNDFENMVRMFFKGYDVTNTGYTNTVKTLYGVK